MKISEEQAKWAEETLSRLEEKMNQVSNRSAEKIPYTVVNGVHDDRSAGDQIGWWTNGFWGGIMWQLYTLTGKEKYRKIAEKVEEKLDRNFLNADMLDHDNGFKWLTTAVADYRVTGNPASRNRGILAADNLAGRFNHAGRFLRAWNDWDDKNDRRGWAIIDCMMNLPLLYWAWETTKDPRYLQTAVQHADTARKNFVREDGSVNHIVEFDVNTGEMVRSYGGQGYGDGSSWTRGQSWGLYGFTLSYLHTKDPAYLATAEKIAGYFQAHIPESGLIPVDFCQPEEVTLEDSTAAAIAACGFLELAKIAEGSKSQGYLDAALKLLHTLAEQRCNWNEAEDDVLQKCTAAYHQPDPETSIIYGDYYFLEALMKLTGKELFIW
ncbi:MAG: glycoside hydrolase family 88 protein [Roseburia sp.]|nr:glycoside hydrolase family 88 protein [Roseburia sp.]MCM1099528.1 glycoside hydrolase family 88 protein [Ruminococcus flavefaciens]